MRLIVECTTPYSLAMLLQDRLFCSKYLIRAICSGVSFALWFFSPFAPLALFLAFMSAILSMCVPINKWEGLTQQGISQWCKTWSSVFKTPRNSSHDKRCAFTALRDTPITPYPFLSTPAVHNQHPVSVIFSIFSLNRFSIVFIPVPYVRRSHNYTLKGGLNGHP